MADVLFICTGNFYRSRFAEAVFNHHAEAAGIDQRAVSRGLATHLVDSDLSPHTARALALRSIAMHRTSLSPTPLTILDLTRAKLSIALHDEEHRPMIATRFPDWVEKVRYWSVSDLPLSPEIALPQIEQNVLALIEQLRATR
jgi:protein-tyrosine phosphatase